MFTAELFILDSNLLNAMFDMCISCPNSFVKLSIVKKKVMQKNLNMLRFCKNCFLISYKETQNLWNFETFQRCFKKEQKALPL